MPPIILAPVAIVACAVITGCTAYVRTAHITPDLAHLIGEDPATIIGPVVAPGVIATIDPISAAISAILNPVSPAVSTIFDLICPAVAAIFDPVGSRIGAAVHPHGSAIASTLVKLACTDIALPFDAVGPHFAAPVNGIGAPFATAIDLIGTNLAAPINPVSANIITAVRTVGGLSAHRDDPLSARGLDPCGARRLRPLYLLARRTPAVFDPHLLTLHLGLSTRFGPAVLKILRSSRGGGQGKRKRNGQSRQRSAS